ncbi:MAG: glycoside hydrolase family 130 protein, partial [Armatimonadota bacterium]
WLATSPDLLHWGCHRPLIARRAGMWDETRIGAGSVPFKTAEGWLAIYHGVNPEQGYCLGAVLMDLEDPSRVLARSEQPLLVPKESYERLGFYGNVVFTCGSVVREDGNVYIYYGAADEHMCCAWIAIDDILASLRPPITLSAPALHEESPANPSEELSVA